MYRRITDAEYDLLKVALIDTRSAWEAKAMESGSAYDLDRLERLKALITMLLDHKGMEKLEPKPKSKSGGYTHGKRKSEETA